MNANKIKFILFTFILFAPLVSYSQSYNEDISLADTSQTASDYLHEKTNGLANGINDLESDNRRRKINVEYENLVVKPGDVIDLTTVLPVKVHSGNGFRYVYSNVNPKPDFIGHTVLSSTSPIGYDFEYLINGQIFAGDNVYLGLISRDTFNSDSIMNNLGLHGSSLQQY